MGRIIPYIMDNKQSLKPPTSQIFAYSCQVNPSFSWWPPPFPRWAQHFPRRKNTSTPVGCCPGTGPLVASHPTPQCCDHLAKLDLVVMESHGTMEHLPMNNGDLPWFTHETWWFTMIYPWKMVIYHDLPMNNGELPWFTHENWWFTMTLGISWGWYHQWIGLREHLQEAPHTDG